MPSDQPSTNSRPSKSAAKREAKRIEELAAYLIGMTDERRRGLALDAELITAARFAATLSRSAARRERLRIAKWLRGDRDAVAVIDAAKDSETRIDASLRQTFRRAEALRDDLVNERLSPIDEPAFDAPTREKVQNLLNDYRTTHDERLRKRCYREIFRAIHEHLKSQHGA